MQVCSTARARATIGGPGRVRRIAWRQALLHCPATLSGSSDDSPAGRDERGAVTAIAIAGRGAHTLPAAMVAPMPSAARSTCRRLTTALPHTTCAGGVL